MTAQLSPRYEIRKLTPEHTEWAKAIICHSNLFYSPFWSVLHASERTERAYMLFNGADYLVEKQINSGYSIGMFDKEYVFKRPESAATGGKLYWDLDDTEADAEKLLDQMDFPLVSVALAYDSIEPMDLEKLGPALMAMPAFGPTYHELEINDKRASDSWKATGPVQVLFRNATSTRHDHEGKGLMKTLAQHMMRVSKEKGFRAIQIECFHPAVTKVWSDPPPPFTGEIVSEVFTAKVEEVGENGKTSHPFHPADVRLTKCYVSL